MDTLSGGYLYDRKLVTHLRNHGDIVEIISLPWMSYPLHLTHNFSSRLRDRLARLRVDVLLQDELNHPSLFILNRHLRKHINYPIVSIVHLTRSTEGHSAWQNAFYNWIERRYLSSVDGFIYNSQTTQRLVERLLMNAEARDLPSLVAYPGGDRLRPQVSDEDIRRRAHGERLRLLFLGNLIPRKGLHILLRALAVLPADSWALAVIGNQQANPSYTQALRRQIVRDGLTDHVRFAGILSDDELANCLKVSHLLVMPSSYEGYGIAYSEGMGFGLPAIGTTEGAAREIITHGRDGFLVEPGDAAALNSHLIELVHNRQLLVEMSLAARIRYESLPVWNESVESIRTFLTELIGDS